MPMAAIYKNLRKWNIKLNKKKVKPEIKLQIWDELRFFIKDDADTKIKRPKGVDYDFLKKSKFFKKNFKKLYEDDDILVLDKPARIAVHPWTNHYQWRTMLDLAMAHVWEVEFLPKLVHRLDLNTSGALLFAKNNLSLQNLNEQMRKHTTTKKYYALVNWLLEKWEWTISLALERTVGKQKSTKVIVSRWNRWKMSTTHYKVEKVYKLWLGQLENNLYINSSLISIKLETGRMHQIRVHMKSQWHCLLWDNHYGDFKLNKQLDKLGLKRMFLHSYFLEITHPKTWELISFKSELPEELQSFLENK